VDNGKALAVALVLDIVLASVITLSVWSGHTTLDSTGYNPAMAVLGSILIFGMVFWTARRDFSKASRPAQDDPLRKLKNLLPFWICAASFVTLLNFWFWLSAHPIRLRDLEMGWIIIAAVVLRVLQYRTTQPLDPKRLQSG
jgi:hypothetical protein